MIARAIFAALAVAALAMAIVLEIAWAAGSAPVFLRAAPLALTVVAVASPTVGLTILAGLGPLAGAVAAYAGSPPMGGPFLEQLVLAVIVGASLRPWRDRQPLRLSVAAAVMGAVAAASAAAAQPGLLLRSEPGRTALEHLMSLLGGGWFERQTAWAPLHAAAVTIEGLGLALVIERVLRAHPAAVVRVMEMAIAGFAAVAALNLERLVEAAARTGDFLASFPHLLVGVRVSRFYDVNAAGSVFVMALIAGFGLVKAPSGRPRAMVLAALGLLAIGLWMSGSRSAMAAFAIAILAVAGTVVATARQGAGRWKGIVALAAVLSAVAVVVAAYPAARNFALSGAFATRRILAGTSLNMWRSAPVFGVGIGRFHEESSRFGAVALREELHFNVVNENAHNNFLQVLAEQGLVGLVSLLLVIGGTLAAAIRAEQAQPWPLRRWLVIGLAAGLLTWISGHPQLVPEAAFAFWLLLGILAAVTAAPDRSGWRTAAWALVPVVLLASAPLRARQAVARLDLEHVGAGVSVWYRDDGGMRYRAAAEAFALYLPADGSRVVLPIRRAPGAPDPLQVAFSARGRVLNEVTIGGDGWTLVPIVLTAGPRKYELVRFAVTATAPLPPEMPLVHVGRASPR